MGKWHVRRLGDELYLAVNSDGDPVVPYTFEYEPEVLMWCEAHNADLMPEIGARASDKKGKVIMELPVKPPEHAQDRAGMLSEASAIMDRVKRFVKRFTGFPEQGKEARLIIEAINEWQLRL